MLPKITGKRIFISNFPSKLMLTPEKSFELKLWPWTCVTLAQIVLIIRKIVNKIWDPDSLMISVYCRLISEQRLLILGLTRRSDWWVLRYLKRVQMRSSKWLTRSSLGQNFQVKVVYDFTVISRFLSLESEFAAKTLSFEIPPLCVPPFSLLAINEFIICENISFSFFNLLAASPWRLRIFRW